MKKETQTKYIVLVGDGMGDYPLPELDGKTPLEAAHPEHGPYCCL
jgi:2,3-bisphosphoglycerate-independent phosphoglycerate mutase